MRRVLKIILMCFAVAAVAGFIIFKFFASPRPAEARAEDNPAPTVITVQTGALQLATLHRYVRGYGTVEAAPATPGQPAASGPLAAPAAGIVAKVMVYEGQHVNQGDVLMELNSGVTTAQLAAQEVARQRTLFAQQNTSQKNLQAAEAQLRMLQVIAPLSGTVTRLNVRPGAAVDATTIVAEVADLDRLAVSADIAASAAGDVKAGEELQTLTQPPVGTRIAFVSPSVDPNNGTVSLWARLPTNTDCRIGQFLPIQIITRTHTNCLAAPQGSVVTDENGRSTISLVQDDEAVQMPVQTGLRENGLVEVEGKGLAPGNIVVTVGAYGLPPKTKIQVATPATAPAPAANSKPTDAK